MSTGSIGLDLFGEHVYPDAEEAPRAEAKPSYGRRLTEAQRALAAQGLNPLTLQRGPEGRTCGECVHRVRTTRGTRKPAPCIRPTPIRPPTPTARPKEPDHGRTHH